MSAKFAGDLRLIEACRQGGCPVCRRVRDESRSHLTALLYEHVTDPDSRRRLRDSWGLCGWHTWMLPEVDTGVFGASIVYEDLLGRAIERLAATAPPSRRRGLGRFLGRRRSLARRPALAADHERRPPCPLCISATESERQCLITFVTSFDDGDLRAAYAASDPICLAHLLQAIELAGPSEQLTALVERTREKWQAIRRDVQSFIAKHDYRNEHAYTEQEAASYTRAFEILAGARGVFGNDMSMRRAAVPARAAPDVNR